MDDLILRHAADSLARGQAVAMVTVAETSRSVPRHAGSKMLVHPDGSTHGTVGGGALEMRAISEAVASLSDRRTRLLTIDLVDPARGDLGVCGGTVRLLVEPLMPRPVAYVIGCGHVGRAVIDLASWLGFRVVACDDRADEVARVDKADVAITGSVDDALAAEPVTADTWVIVVTRNPDLDVETLPAVLATPAPYVGVMGSARRWATTRSRLLERGVSAADLERVRNPIGLEVNAETPEEIAVSVMAQIVAERRG